MSRTRRTWIGFAACVAAVVAALGWVTLVSLRLERRESEARAEAQFQESLRLGLWRMDSLLAPLIAQEAARPYSQYVASQVPNPLFNRAVTAAQTPGDGSEFIRLHFQVGPDGVIASPEITDAGANEATTTTQRNDQRPATASDMLARLRRLVTREVLLTALAEARQTGGELVITRRSPYAQQTLAERTAQDYSARQQVANLAHNAIVPQQQASGPGELTVTLGGFVPMWRRPGKGEQPELLFIRLVTTGRTRIVQGVWADWPRLKRWLLDAVRDVLPGADLRPVVKSDLSPPEARMLASIPAVVEVPPAALPGPVNAAFFTPTRVTLVIAWAAALAAVTAVGLVLRAVIGLGERRLQFASAVTHELRTPLTTFRMYSEMLVNGMVRDDETRREYLATLTREAERLTNVVENVLLYARVEQRRAATRCEPIAAADLVTRVSGRLAQRADNAKMQLVIDEGGADNIVVVTDCQAVEQILFNLVDNSCKYAGSAADRRLHLSVRTTGSSLEMLYWDHGPGIPAAEERRAFEAFRRGSREAAGSAPGVGLGLALARGLARELGGDLKLVRRPDAGAAFLLALPLDHGHGAVNRPPR